VEVPQRQFLQVRVDVDPQIADHPGADRAGELVFDKGEHAAGHGDDGEAPATATSRSGRCPRRTVSMRTFSNQMRAANSSGVQALAASATARGNQDGFSSTTKRR